MENLLALLLQARNVAHVHHWKTKSFSLHLALGELYETITEFADALAEMSIGDLGDNDKLGSVAWDEPTGWDKGDPIAFIGQLHQYLEELKKTIPQDDWLINKYEELQGEVSQIKYKADNLK